MPGSAQSTSGGPTRVIGPIGLTFVAVGGVVGSGWLFGPLFAARVAGPAAIIAWLLGGAMVLVTALPFAEVAAMLPVVGGLGRLPQFSHGSVVGMFIGWVAWIGYVTAAPIEVQALLEYASNESAFRWLFNEGAGTGNNPLSLGGLLVAFALLGVFTIINAYGVKLFNQINTPLTWFKIIVPVVAAIFLLTKFDSSNLTVDGFAPSGITGIFSAIATGGVVFSFLGFRHALDLAGEARKPQVTVPVALTVSLLICIVLFVVVQFAFIGAVPPESLKDGWASLKLAGANGPITAVLAAVGFTAIANLVLADAIAGPLGAGLVASASTARLSVAVSRDGLFPASIQRFSNRGVPLRSLVMNMVVGMVVLLVFRDGWQEILTFNTAAIVLSFCAGPVTLVALRHQLPDRHRPFRLRHPLLVGYVSFVIVGLIVHWTGWDTLKRIAVPIVLGGVIFAWRVWRTRARRASGAYASSDAATTDLTEEFDIREAAWLLPWFGGLFLLSWIGGFGDGHNVLSPFWGSAATALLAVAIFPLAVKLRLPAERTAAYVDEDVREVGITAE
ncbi:MAG: APC family permease [Microthrixaceae bacterium]